MDEKDNLNQEQDFNSTPSNLPIEVKENKLKTFIDDLSDPMISWRIREGFRDFTDSVSMSAVGQAFKRMMNSITSTVSNFANRIKESAENRRNNDPSKTGINVSTIETQAPTKSEVIMPQAAGKVAKEAPSTIILAQSQTKGDTLINNSKTAEDVRAEAAENGLKLEDIDVDKDAIIEKEEPQVSDVTQNPVQHQITSGEINIGQPVKTSDTKDLDDFEK